MLAMPWTVLFHSELADEFGRLDEAVQTDMLAHVALLKQVGPTLGRPAVDTLKGSRIANLKELRFSGVGGAWRVAFAFDGNRIAVLLAAGDKGGKDQGRFYKALIKLAEERWSTWVV